MNTALGWEMPCYFGEVKFVAELFSKWAFRSSWFCVVVDVLQPLHLDFIAAAANLRAAIYGIAQTRDHRGIAEMAMEVDVPVFVPKAGVRIELTESEVQSRNNGSYG